MNMIYVLIIHATNMCVKYHMNPMTVLSDRVALRAKQRLKRQHRGGSQALSGDGIRWQSNQ